MPQCKCSAIIQSGTLCSQCELEEWGDIYRNQCSSCGTTGVDDGFCEDCSERNSHRRGDA